MYRASSLLLTAWRFIRVHNSMQARPKLARLVNCDPARTEMRAQVEKRQKEQRAGVDGELTSCQESGGLVQILAGKNVLKSRKGLLVYEITLEP